MRSNWRTPCVRERSPRCLEHNPAPLIVSEQGWQGFVPYLTLPQNRTSVVDLRVVCILRVDVQTDAPHGLCTSLLRFLPRQV